jgi:hypothetical protein
VGLPSKRAILMIVMGTSLTACSMGSSTDLSCSSADRSGWIRCREAITIERDISVTEDVSTPNVKASIGRHAVAEGKTVPAWVVTSLDAVYRPPSGVTCKLPSFTVIVVAATGRLLAWDTPPFGGCNVPIGAGGM